MKPISQDQFHSLIYTNHIQPIQENLSNLISYHLKKILSEFKVFLSYMKFLKERIEEEGQDEDNNLANDGDISSSSSSNITTSMQSVTHCNNQLKSHFRNYRHQLITTRHLFSDLRGVVIRNGWGGIMGSAAGVQHVEGMIGGGNSSSNSSSRKDSISGNRHQQQQSASSSNKRKHQHQHQQQQQQSDANSQHHTTHNNLSSTNSSHVTYNDLIQSNEQLYQDLLSIWDLIHLIYTSINEREAVWVYNTWWIVLKRAQQVFVDTNRVHQNEVMLRWEREMVNAGYVMV